MIFLLVRERPLVSNYVFPMPPGKDLWLTIATGFSKPTLLSPKFEMKHFARLKALYSREMLDEKITRFPTNLVATFSCRFARIEMFSCLRTMRGKSIRIFEGWGKPPISQFHFRLLAFSMRWVNVGQNSTARSDVAERVYPISFCSLWWVFLLLCEHTSMEHELKA